MKKKLKTLNYINIKNKTFWYSYNKLKKIQNALGILQFI